jgi:[histone H3]-lysine36 N-dimethyltransferase SETMAR
MHRIAAKFVPKLLTEEQRVSRIMACSDLIRTQSRCSDFINHVITGDETLVYGYDPETKVQSSEWHRPSSPRPKQARQSKSKIKIMLIIFFDIRGIVYREYVPFGQTINQEYYKDVLCRLRDKVFENRHRIYPNEHFYLHHENAPAHTSILIQEFLSEEDIPIVPHPLYSPDLTPCDFFLFPRIKSKLKGKRFENIESIKRNVDRELSNISPDESKICFENWKHRWKQCIFSSGNYFEGDKFLE